MVDVDSSIAGGDIETRVRFLGVVEATVRESRLAGKEGTGRGLLGWALSIRNGCGPCRDRATSVQSRRQATGAERWRRRAGIGLKGGFLRRPGKGIRLFTHAA